MIEEKLPPQNIEAEKSLLGSLLIDKAAINKIADIVRSEDFYKYANSLIYEAIIDLFEKNEPIDILSVTNRLEEKADLEKIGGVGYLTELINSVPTAAHVLHYAKIVARKKSLRDLNDAAQEIIILGHKEEEDIEILLDEAEQKLFRVSQKRLSQEFVPLSSALSEAWERVEKLHKGDGRLRGISTGFYELDNKLAGLQKSDLVVLAARPSLGKTSLALDIARNTAKKEKVTVGIFSLEMSREQIVDRFLASEAQVDLWKLRTGRLSTEGEYSDFQKISEALDTLSQVPIFIDDAPSPNIMQIRTMARRLQAEKGLGLIIVDYLQLILPRKDSDSMVQQVTEISRSLKSLAKELNIPVLAISQLSRAVEVRPDQRPRLSDLRESGSIEQDADVVLFIYREDRVRKETDNKNIAEIIIAKHRNGPTGEIKLFFDENRVTFKNLETKL